MCVKEEYIQMFDSGLMKHEMTSNSKQKLYKASDKRCEVDSDDRKKQNQETIEMKTSF